MKDMENNKFKNRVYGAVLVKAQNSNYNADFTGQPRTLPNGTVYATDKAFKYTVRKYVLDNYPDEKVFFFKRLKDGFTPLTLEEAYIKMFEEEKPDKKKVASDLLSCIDIKLFGATFAMKGKENIALAIHGPVQITHGINIWKENNIFSEQIQSPFRNPNENKTEAEATTLGRQSRLEEGHYLHHFSINPKNLEEIANLLEDENTGLTVNDIYILKEAMRKGATYYDSTSKAGVENEFLIWVQLIEGSKLVLPNFIELVKMESEKEDGKVVLDLYDLSEVLKEYDNEIEAIEVYYNDKSIVLKNIPKEAQKKDIIDK